MADDNNNEEGTEATVRLRNGLRLDELHSTGGATFEILTEDISNEEHGDESEGYPYFGPELLKYTKPEFAAIHSDEEDEDDETPFEQLKKKMICISAVSDDSIMKMVLKPGIGDGITADAQVTIHYNAYLEYQDEPFDSSYLRNKITSFRLNQQNVIAGLDLSVATMRLREKSQFLIHPDWAYGEQGCPPRIPKNAWILYEVELLDVVENAAAEAFRALPLEEQLKTTFEEMIRVCEAECQSGNSHVRHKRDEKAEAHYFRAITLLKNATVDVERCKERDGLLLRLFSNVSFVYLRMEKYRKAKKYALKALQIDQNHTKALYRMAKASRKLHELGEARKYLNQALAINPDDLAIVEELENLSAQEEENKTQERDLCQRMMSATVTETIPSNQKKREIDFVDYLSPEFIEMVNNTLTQFKEDSNKDELVLPGFSNIEVSCVAAATKVLGLDIIISPQAIKVTKKK